MTDSLFKKIVGESIGNQREMTKLQCLESRLRTKEEFLLEAEEKLSEVLNNWAWPEKDKQELLYEVRDKLTAARTI